MYYISLYFLSASNLLLCYSDILVQVQKKPLSNWVLVIFFSFGQKML